MALIEYTEEELAQMSRSSYAPEEEEFSRSNFGALGSTYNSILNSADRGNDILSFKEKPPVNLDDYAEMEFSRDSLRSSLEKEGYSPDAVAQVMQMPVYNWEAAFIAAEREKSKEKRARQVNQNFTPTEQLIYGGGMGFADLDIVTGLPVLKAVKTINKTFDLSKKGQIGVSALGGAGFGIVAEGGYQFTEGQTDTGHLTDAALIGMGFGGVLGTFAARSELNPKLITRFDEQAQKLVDEEAAIVTQQTEAKAQLSKVDEVIAKVKEWQTKKKDTKEALKAAKGKDLQTAKINAPIIKTSAEKAAEYAGKVYDETKALTAKAKQKVTDMVKEGETVTKNLVRWEAETTQYTKDKADLDRLVSERTPLKGQVTRLTNTVNKLTDQIAELEAAFKKSRSKTKRKEFEAQIKAAKQKQKQEKAKLRKATTAFNRKETEVERATKKTAKFDQNIPSYVKQSTKRWQDIQKEQPVVDKAYADMQTRLEEAKGKNVEAKKTLKDSSRKVTRRSIDTSPEVRALEDELAQYKADLTPAGIKRLLDERDLLTDDLKKLDEGDFNLSRLYGIRKEKLDAATKLDQELTQIDNANDFRDTSAWKSLPNWMQKIVISPIEKSLSDENPYVRGLARLLHSGTTHHGKINTRNAWAIKTFLDMKHNRMQKAIEFSYKKAVEAGFKGKMNDFEREIARHSNYVISQMKRDAYSGIDGTIKGADREKIAMAQLQSAQRKHISRNEWVNKAVDDYLDYYEEVFKYGQRVDLKAFKGKVGKAYVQRLYSREAIEAMGRDKAIDFLVEAQESYAISTGRDLTPEISENFRQMATNAVDGSLNSTNRLFETVGDIGVAKGGQVESQLKARNIEVFDDEIFDLLEDDVIGSSHLYATKIHGRIALKEKLGVDTNDEIQGMLDDLRAKGATPNAVSNIKAMVQTIQGTREVSRNPYDPSTRAMKMASTYSSAMHTLGFAVPTITEIASISKEFGWSKTINTLVGTPSEITRMYRYGTPSDKNSIELMVSYGDALFTTKANRFDVESTLDSVGRTQEFLDGTVRRFAVYGGLMPITDMMRMATASLSVDFLAKLSVAKKISKTDRMRMQDMGFDVEDLQRIRDTLKVDASGRINNMDRKSWGKLDEELTLGVQTMVERTILHPNGITLPKFMTNMNEGQIVPRVLMKFMRFPFESYERLLLRGIQEADAKQMMALAGNIAMWTAILQMKDSMKDPIDQEFNGKDGLDKLMMQSFFMNSVTSLPFAMADHASGLLTGKNATNDWDYRFGGAVGSDMSKLLRGDPTLSLPMTPSIHIGDGVSYAARDIFGLEQLWEE